MKIQFALILSAWLGSAYAVTPVQITGTWSKNQAIEAFEGQSHWQFTNGNDELSITAAPTPFTSAKVGDWLNLDVRQNPAGKTQIIRWSSDEDGAPFLILNQNSTFMGEALPGWRWNGNLLISNKQQQRKLKVGKVSYINGWCILISELRPAKPNKAGIANESETRFDSWAQYKPKVCVAK